MSLALLLALQSVPAAPPAPATPAPPAPAPAPLAVDFDLAQVKPADRCASEGDVSEILVCGRRPGGTYDLAKWARVFETGPLRAETAIGRRATAGAYVESAAMPGGAVSKRAMVGVKIKF